MRRPLRLFAALLLAAVSARAADKPHIVLVMADDMGWGQTGYYDHPVLKTPHLDAMAANGLRFDRFYAGASNCSPTRATVLTGRSNDRTGVFNHGYPLRQQEKTLPEALQKAGYATGHFGKWHLNGLRGPGVPIFKDDTHGPAKFGFGEWVSVTNFYDLDPPMSDNGEFKQYKGDSSEIAIDRALEFIGKHAKAGKPSFSVIWYGTPHSPFRALEKDRAVFAGEGDVSADHYGELVAMDRSIGTLRAGLREMGIADDTLVWFCSDNGGLPGIKPDTVGGLRGFKGSMYEGGIRVPGIIEWPAKVKPRVTERPAGTVDIFPTLGEIVGLPDSAMLQPQDGQSLLPMLEGDDSARSTPLGFRHQNRPILIDNDYKLHQVKGAKGYELYNLADDPAESKNLIAEKPDIAKRMQTALEAWVATVDASVEGKDYPEGKVDPDQPPRVFWRDVEAYKGYVEKWGKKKASRKTRKK